MSTPGRSSGFILHSSIPSGIKASSGSERSHHHVSQSIKPSKDPLLELRARGGPGNGGFELDRGRGDGYGGDASEYLAWEWTRSAQVHLDHIARDYQGFPPYLLSMLLSRHTSIHGKDLMDVMGAGNPSHPGLDLRGDIRLSCN